MTKTWSLEEINLLYHLPILELVHQAASVHRQYHNSCEIQVCHLVSIKSGGCPEDCKYCAFSSHYETPVKAQPLMKHEEVIEKAKKAKEKGCTRFCMGAAWREVRDNWQFSQVLEMIKTVTAMGLEVCCTLGMLDLQSALRLAEAGLYAYNHNLDTSETFYKTIITTRTYQDRLQTLKVANAQGMGVCCGGIIGLGETAEDRIQLLHTLANLKPYPESVPINRLTPIPGTPLAHRPQISSWEVIRMVALARILMPAAMIRLAAGRLGMSETEQALCFMAGANSIFSGSKLLSVDNPDFEEDDQLLKFLGFHKQLPFCRTCK